MKRIFTSLMLAALALLVGLPVQAQTIRPLASVQVLAQSAVQVPVTGTTSPTVQATIKIPAGLMGPSGALRVSVFWTLTNSANTKVQSVSYGGANFFAISTTTVSHTVTQVIIQNRGGPASQVSQVLGNFGAGSGTSTAIGTGAVDSMQEQDLVIYCTLSNASESCQLERYTVELLKP